MKIDPKIFKAYDIRGIYPEEINEEAAKQIAKAFVKFLDAKKVAIGYDMRPCSKGLHAAMIEKLLEMGVEIYDLGLTSTPQLYFAPPHLGVDGGIMITASHNPMNYGGIKFVDSEATAVFQENGMLDIAKLSANEMPTADIEKGTQKKINILEDYVGFLKNNLGDLKNYSIVIDTMHGMMGPVIKELFKDSTLKVKIISDNPDSNIPGYETPNPLLGENRKKIREAIRQEKADLGAMFDGDGDRMSIVDKNGELISNNFVASLISTEILLEEKGGVVVGDVRASLSVIDAVKAAGGEYFIAKAGNPYVKEVMMEKDAVFGFETSGHMFFRKTNFAEGSDMGLLYLLRALSRYDKSPQEVFDDFKLRYIIEKEINYRISDENVLDKVEEKYRGSKITKLDGLTVEFDNYRFNIRTSNTEPLIRLNMEANSKEILEEKKKEFTDFIISLGGEISDH